MAEVHCMQSILIISECLLSAPSLIPLEEDTKT